MAPSPICVRTARRRSPSNMTVADRAEVQVADAIGKSQPVGVFVETFGTVKLPVARIQAAVLQVFDLRPAAIIRDLDLLRPIYAETAAYGHFGRDGFPWESTARTDTLRAAAELSARTTERRSPALPVA